MMYMNKIKSYRHIIYGAFIMLVVFANGCTDGYDELNTPTDRIVADEVDASLLSKTFASAEWDGVRGGGGSLQTGKNLFADLYSQYFATTSANFDSDQYEEIASWVNGSVWRNPYANALREIKFVKDYTEENGMDARNAVVKIWSIHVYHQLTDYFGPIIYSDYGSDADVIKYDSQKEIYHDFFDVLQNSVNVLEQYRGENRFGQNDIIFGGDLNKWITYANSLRLRLAMRVSYVDQELAKEQAEAAVEGGVMMNNEDNAWVHTTTNNRNQFTRITLWGEFRMSASAQSILKGFEDPRIGSLYSEADWKEDRTPCGGCGYRGLRNGLPRSEKNPEINSIYSDMAQPYLAPSLGGGNPPVQVMRASEVYFLRSEGALRGWNMNGNAQELYEKGIRTSMEEWEAASATEITDYINSNNTPAAYVSNYKPSWDIGPLSDITVAWDDSGDFETNLEQIITQKWISLYPDGLEAWAEFRRTKYPKLYPIIKSRNPDIPESDHMSRLTFVSSEYSDNPEGVETGIKELDGPDKNTTKVWWDAKPDEYNKNY